MRLVGASTINLTNKLQVAEIERKDNPSVLDNCDFFFFDAKIGKCKNIFRKCSRVHVTNCEIMFIQTDTGLVAFVEAKDA